MGKSGNWGLHQVFCGEFNNTVDLKGRVSIPAEFRETLLSSLGDEVLSVTKNNGGLIAYPLSRWQKIRQKVIDLPTGPDRTDNMRTRISPAKECRFDKQGRIQLPQALREYAEIKTGTDTDIVIVGMFDKIEIWNRQKYAEASRESEARIHDKEQFQADLGF